LSSQPSSVVCIFQISHASESNLSVVLGTYGCVTGLELPADMSDHRCVSDLSTLHDIVAVQCISQG